jgi:hypothetical protein
MSRETWIQNIIKSKHTEKQNKSILKTNIKIKSKNGLRAR